MSSRKLMEKHKSLHMPARCNDYFSPYNNLYIYYLKGRIEDNATLGKGSFIGNWEEEGDSFLFFSEPADAVVNILIKNQPHLVLSDQFEMTYEQWQGERITSYCVGRLFITPPWSEDHAPGDKLCIQMDPGVVFGTGTHPTTKDCLAALHLALEHQTVRRAVDLGTGTGLLALAAAALGAKKVLAVDLNRLAVCTALGNVKLNAMTHRILVAQGNAKNFIDLACDLMVSNIHYAVMRPMIEAAGFCNHKQIILSGLLRSQAREVEDLLKKKSVKILHKWEQDNTWFTYWGSNACTI